MTVRTTVPTVRSGSARPGPFRGPLADGSSCRASVVADPAHCEFQCGLEVARGTPRTGIVGHHGLAVARRLRHSYIARDDRLKNLLTEVVPDVLLDRVGQAGTTVVH